MAQHVGHGQPAGRLGRGQLEARHVVSDLAVPAQCAIVDQQAGHGAGEGLGQRGKAEHRVRVDRLRVADVGDAVAARGKDAPVLHDRHRDAGHAVAVGELLGHRFDGGDVETVRQRLHLVRPQGDPVGHRLRRRRQRRVLQVRRQVRRRFRQRQRRGGRLRGGGQCEGHQYTQQSRCHRTETPAPVVVFHRDRCLIAEAVGDSSAAFRDCTNQKKMNGHRVDIADFCGRAPPLADIA